MNAYIFIHGVGEGLDPRDFIGLNFEPKSTYYFNYAQDLEVGGFVGSLLPPFAQMVAQSAKYALSPKLRRTLSVGLAFFIESINETSTEVTVVAHSLGTVVLLNMLLSGLLKILRPDLKLNVVLLGSPMNRGLLLNTLPNKKYLINNNINKLLNVHGSKDLIAAGKQNKDYRMLLTLSAGKPTIDDNQYKGTHAFAEYLKHIKEQHGYL